MTRRGVRRNHFGAMGAAQSAEDLPPNVFLPEAGQLPELGVWSGGGGGGEQRGLEAYCSCWEKKKTPQPDIRIAHNRPVIYQVHRAALALRYRRGPHSCADAGDEWY